MSKTKDLSNKKFGRLTVIRLDKKASYGEWKWLCECECGNKVSVSGRSLRRGATKSCGCLRNEAVSQANTKHGLSETKIYHIWEKMRARCRNDKDPAYANYGGRGICVCEEWDKDFLAFYKWSINNGYSEKLSIDRINNDGNYEPSNCRWATRKQQMNNTRTNHMLTHDGKTKTISQWADFFDVPYDLFYGRLSNNNWEIDDEVIDTRDRWTKRQGGCIDVSTFVYSRDYKG